MKRWAVYTIVFLLGGLTALGMNPSFFSRLTSVFQTDNVTISEGAATTSGVLFEEETVRVARVIDGDTIELVDGRKVRYIGIDAPEMGDARETIACFAREAMEENKRLADGKTVRLEKDVSETDRYGRLLRYVYIDDVFINDYLVRQGFARVDTVPPDVDHQDQFLEAQREAQGQGVAVKKKQSMPACTKLFIRGLFQR